MLLKTKMYSLKMETKNIIRKLHISFKQHVAKTFSTIFIYFIIVYISIIIIYNWNVYYFNYKLLFSIFLINIALYVKITKLKQHVALNVKCKYYVAIFI